MVKVLSSLFVVFKTYMYIYLEKYRRKAFKEKNGLHISNEEKISYIYYEYL